MNWNSVAQHRFWKSAAALLLGSIMAVSPIGLSYAVDPPYQAEMRRLNEIMGGLYFLQPLCVENPADWRALADELITLDKPDEDRRARLIGAFNEGYESYSRLYRWCSEPAVIALTRLLIEAEHTSRDIHSRYAE
jgi:uncharacterized protein (TIGR02301 family)